MHTALALETSRVQCGALVYSVGFRHPAVLAKAVTAIDLLSGGRAAIGLGAGWAEVEYNAYGIDFPSVGTRHGPARGSAPPACAACCTTRSPRSTAAGSRSARRATSPGRCRRGCRSGSAAAASGARCASPPRYADGWNVPFMSPETFGRKRDVLHDHCADVGPRPERDRCAPSTSGWRGRRRACASSSARSPTSCVPACSAAPSPRSSTASASTSPPVPIRSTSRCAPRSTSTPSSASPPPSSFGLTRHWLSRRCFCSSNSAAVSVPRSRIASNRSSRSITSVTAAGSAFGMMDLEHPLLVLLHLGVDQVLDLVRVVDVGEALLPAFGTGLDEQIAGTDDALDDRLAEVHAVDAFEGDLDAALGEHAVTEDHAVAGDDEVRRGPLDEADDDPHRARRRSGRGRPTAARRRRVHGDERQSPRTIAAIRAKTASKKYSQCGCRSTASSS